MATYKELKEVNDSMTLKNIKSKKGNSKEYAAADEKIKAFRKLYPDGGINTKILSIKDGVCIAHAEITDATGHILGAGTASKKQTSDNSDSFIEACETAAVGRALRFVGIGLENIINEKETVVDEVQALLELGELRGKIMAYVIRHKLTDEKIKAICDRYKVAEIMDLNADCCRHYIDYIEKNGGNINE